MIQIEKDTERVNWKKIKAEYLAGGTSYRKLAGKYGISYQSIARKATAENWGERRESIRNRAETKAEQKIIDKTAETMADNAEIASDIKHSLLLRLQRIEKKYPIDATEIRSKQGNSLAVFRLKDLTAAYKDLMDIQLPSDADNTAMNDADKMLVAIRKAAENDISGGGE